MMTMMMKTDGRDKTNSLHSKSLLLLLQLQLPNQLKALVHRNKLYSYSLQRKLLSQDLRLCRTSAMQRLKGKTKRLISQSHP